MSDKLTDKKIAGILELFIEVEKELCESTVSIISLRLALETLVPGLSDEYKKHLAGPTSLQVRREYEQRIGALLEKSQKMSRD